MSRRRRREVRPTAEELTKQFPTEFKEPPVMQEPEKEAREPGTFRGAEYGPSDTGKSGVLYDNCGRDSGPFFRVAMRVVLVVPREEHVLAVLAGHKRIVRIYRDGKEFPYRDGEFRESAGDRWISLDGTDHREGDWLIVVETWN